GVQTCALPISVRDVLRREPSEGVLERALVPIYVRRGDERVRTMSGECLVRDPVRLEVGQHGALDQIPQRIPVVEQRRGDERLAVNESQAEQLAEDDVGRDAKRRRFLDRLQPLRERSVEAE